ncbi:hypothetical protein COMA2_10395 [Candidatus Nitrospira nitrificans]|uniref:Uncharacterized protein n=1 Tax=Candidatus Nitrospira nitrificans TaxID=1742973 RepID=A0A0S4L5K9_9BACT|nr:hypothetical protein COMA2_10395 [Candidatus Nitrospira nitrificans]
MKHTSLYSPSSALMSPWQSGLYQTLKKMAGPTGFEPATSRLTIWRPNQAERRPRKIYRWQNNSTTRRSRWSPINSCV